jgi:hypothetical protein
MGPSGQSHRNRGVNQSRVGFDEILLQACNRVHERFKRRTITPTCLCEKPFSSNGRDYFYCVWAWIMMWVNYAANLVWSNISLHYNEYWS